MNSKNPFNKCPIYETNNLIFMKIKEEDAAELFQCYSDPLTLSRMNNDNCGGDWDMYSVEVMIEGIKGWKQEFDDRFYIRWSVKHKQLNKIIGTIEIAPVPNTTRFWDGLCKTGILRIDVISYLQNEAIFSEILEMVTNNFYGDFNIENVIIKATKDDTERISALKSNEFDELKKNTLISYNDYFVKSNK